MLMHVCAALRVLTHMRHGDATTVSAAASPSLSQLCHSPCLSRSGRRSARLRRLPPRADEEGHVWHRERLEGGVEPGRLDRVGEDVPAPRPLGSVPTPPQGRRKPAPLRCHRPCLSRLGRTPPLPRRPRPLRRPKLGQLHSAFRRRLRRLQRRDSHLRRFRRTRGSRW